MGASGKQDLTTKEVDGEVDIGSDDPNFEGAPSSVVQQEEGVETLSFFKSANEISINNSHIEVHVNRAPTMTSDRVTPTTTPVSSDSDTTQTQQPHLDSRVNDDDHRNTHIDNAFRGARIMKGTIINNNMYNNNSSPRSKPKFTPTSQNNAFEGAIIDEDVIISNNCYNDNDNARDHYGHYPGTWAPPQPHWMYGMPQAPWGYGPAQGSGQHLPRAPRPPQ